MKVIPPTPFSTRTSEPKPVVIEDIGPVPPLGDQIDPGCSSDNRGPHSSTSLPSTPTGGRRSAQVLQLLQKGCEEMEAILERVAVETSMTTQQVAESWHRDRGRIIIGPNYWNKYQAFWKANEDSERQRAGIGSEEPATPSGEDWKETLDIFELTEITKTSEHTLAQRA
ncbi:hypothetical protein L210DRAFT_988923 [Boletus edulis BED1]|uniref:Uncharacterized protein n=1 Tax=Boletus edulis BED1 TaxID=1328754 RepID=A0AAD4BF48_BOLED|nr:hypothetical protein L210DRAFT_988923 [Boletus edulis BED1]